MIRRIHGSIFAILAVASVGTLPAHAAAKSVVEILRDGQPNIKSAAALVIDLANDQVLFEKGADEVRPIASISKLFGALVLAEECKLDPEVLHEMTVSNREAARGGDKTKLITGWSYTHRDLLHAALMRSDNRALPALAEACGLDPAGFAAKMTAKARGLGLVKTVFKEPDGLSRENVSTAREVMVALRAAIKVAALTEIMGKPDYVLTAHKGGRTQEIKIRNTDRLLTKNIAQILGGKTGYTDPARYCLAVAARTPEGREVGMVFLGAEGRFTRFADFTRVVRWLASDRAFAASAKPGAAPASPAPQVAVGAGATPAAVAGAVPSGAAVAPVAGAAPAVQAASVAPTAVPAAAGTPVPPADQDPHKDGGPTW